MKPNPMPASPLDALLSNPAIRSTRNDYIYRSGWNRSAVLGQQFNLDTEDARALIKAIDASPPERQKALLAELVERSESQQSTGSVALSASAAAELNAFAKRLGMNVTFKSGQRPPLHPMG
jgi:hypothetical protein